MKKILVGLLLILSCFPANAQKSKSALQSEINTLWPDNTQNKITPKFLRIPPTDIVNSYLDLNGAASFFCPGGQALIGFSDLSTPNCATVSAGSVPVGGITGLGTGVATALGVNVGTAGAFVVNGGALGTPISGNAANLTNMPLNSLSGFGANVPTWLATPTSANLRAAITDETGTGVSVFGTAPTISSLNATVGMTLAFVTGSTQCLQVNTSGVISGSGGTCGGSSSPGGSNTQLQYNNSGSFGGTSGATATATQLTLVAPILGTPASGTLTNATGLPLTTGVTGTLGVGNGGTGGTTFTSGAPILGAGGGSLTLPTYSGGTTSLPLVSNSPSAAQFQQISSSAISDASTAYANSVLVKRDSTAGIVGTNTNDNAASGSVGEYVSNIQNSAQPLTTASPLSITSASLTAGDWEVICTISVTFAATTVMQAVVASTNTTINALGTFNQLSSFNFGTTSSLVPNGGFTVSSPRFRYSLNATTTVYCTAQSNFTTSTATAVGFISARRVR